MIIKLKNIGTIITGNTPSKKNAKYYDSNDIYFIKPDTLDDSKITVLNSSNEFISNNARDKARIVGKNAILITCIGSIGKVGIVTEGEYAFNQQINAVIPNELVIPQYLAYCLLFNKDKLIDIANAPVVPIINKTQFGEFEININEDLSVQQKIVNELNTIQKIILKQRQELEKMDDLIKARFVEMFGDIVYPEDTLLNLCNIIDYRGKTPEKVEYGLPFITARNIKMHQMHLEPREYISKETYDKVMTRGFPKEGDVVFTTEAPLGNVCRIPHFDTEFYIGQRIVTLQTEKLEPIYLEYALSSDKFKTKYMGKSSGSTVTGIRVKLLEQLTIAVPPIELQQQFADFVKQVDKSKFIQMNSTI